jgi:hypothetical protein
VALRGLAVLATDASERDDLYRRASQLAPDDRRLAVERLAALVDAGRPDEVVAVASALPQPVREHGRTRLLVAQALEALGRDDAALAILRDLVVPDLAEGDRALSEVWERLRPGEPVPAHLDFRMAPREP